MKAKSKKYQVNSFLVVLFIVVTICSTNLMGQNNATSIEGNWMLDFNTSLNALSVEKAQKINEKSALIKQKITSSYQGKIYKFNTNGTYEITNANGGSVYGNWVLNNGILQLTDSVNSVTRTYGVLLTNSHLVLSLSSDFANTALIPNLYLGYIE